MKKTIIIVVIVVALLLVGGYFAKKQYKKAMKYCYNYNIKNSKIKTISATLLDIDFALDFKNSSDIEFDVDGYKFDVLLNNVKISDVSNTSKIVIKANGFTTITIPIKINPTALLSQNILNIETLKNLVSDRSKISIAIKGVVSGGALGVSVSEFPLEISMSLAEIMKPSKEPKTECK